MLHVHMYCIPLEGPFFEKRRIKLLRANDLDFMIIRAYIFWVANGEFTIILFLLKITFSSITTLYKLGWASWIYACGDARQPTK